MTLCADRMDYVHSDIRGPLYQEALRMKAEGISVLRLNTGNPAAFGFAMPESVKKALSENMDRAVAYCDSRGMPQARNAILAYHRAKGVRCIEDRDIFIGNGVSEMAEMTATAIFNPGDEILVPCPNYSLWTNCAHLAGAKPVFYRCDEAQHWFPDTQDIRKKVTSRTRAILIINPNNPTGVLYSRDVLLDILEIARENRLLVLADEIYDRLVMDGKKHESCAALAPDLNVITYNGLSKSHVICGFRCGWMAISSPDDRLKEARDALERLSSMRLCGNVLTQLVIPAALEDSASTMEMLAPGGRLFEQRKAVMEALSNAEGISAVPNDAAFYVFPKVDVKKFRVTDDHELCMSLLKQKHILIVPGSGFGFPTPDHFRIVMLPKPDELRGAMTKILDYLNERAG